MNKTNEEISELIKENNDLRAACYDSQIQQKELFNQLVACRTWCAVWCCISVIIGTTAGVALF